MKKIGIITFHNSYNCGSMLESYAMQHIVSKYGKSQIINYSSDGQKELYSVFSKNNSMKKIIKNILIFPAYKKIKLNNQMYEKFKNTNYSLSNEVDSNTIKKLKYDIVIAGSDQIWNVTIDDFNEVYLLNWVKNAKKVAYSPSFGAKNPVKYYDDVNYFTNLIKDFDCLSVRENNGKKWLKDLTDKNVPVLLDPTLLLSAKDYDLILDSTFTPNKKYIFFYSPSFDRNMCRFVKKVAKKYNLKVITWSTKSYYIKFIKQFGFELPPYESPAVYLNLVKNADLVMTTSYHGTIFSTIYKKKFYTLKNGGMYGEDDRVLTLINSIGLMDRLIKYDFDDSYDYLEDINYDNYDLLLKKLQKKSWDYLDKSLNIKE